VLSPDLLAASFKKLPHTIRHLEGGISVGFENIGPDSEEVSKPHAHEPAYFSMLVHGDCQEQIEARTHDLMHWDLAYHPPGEVHARRPRTKIYGAFGMLVPAPLLNRLESELGRRVEPARAVAAPSFGRSLAQEWLNTGPVSDLALTSIFYETLARAGAAECNEPGIPSWLRQARDLIHDDREATLAKIADAVGISAPHLARQFRKTFRVSVGDYSRTIRLEEAMMQLRNSQACIAQIAVQTGFSDESHLNKAFKSKFGMTPGAYRKSWN
jgi:AraC family transcriptional regulator